MTTLRAGAATDVGRVREINEDRYLAADVIFAVADGVGGHQAGEIASQTSVDKLRDGFVEHTTGGLVEAVNKANEAVWRLAQERPDRRGMGTTLAALALVVDEADEQLAVANVGDSRVYLLSPGEFTQLTRDHSLVEEMVREGRISPDEARVHHQRSIITRALGMEPAIEVDVWALIPNEGDRYLLCSDGLTNELSDARISATLRRLGDPAEAARELVRQARAEGGADNITAVVVDVVDDDDRAEKASAALGRSQPERSAAATDTRVAPALASSAPIGRMPAAGKAGSVPAGSVSADGAAGSVPAGRVSDSAWRPSPPSSSDPPPPGAGARAGSGDRWSGRRGPSFTWRTALFVVAVLTVVGSAIVAVGWYAKGTYFVRLDGGRVAIYQGRPGGLLWFEPTFVKQPSRPTLDEIRPAERQVLQRGRLFPTLAAADIYLNGLLQQADQRAAASTTTVPPDPSTTLAPSTGAPAGTTPPPPTSIGAPPVP